MGNKFSASSVQYATAVAFASSVQNATAVTFQGLLT